MSAGSQCFCAAGTSHHFQDHHRSLLPITLQTQPCSLLSSRNERVAETFGTCDLDDEQLSPSPASSGNDPPLSPRMSFGTSRTVGGLLHERYGLLLPPLLQPPLAPPPPPLPGHLCLAAAATRPAGGLAPLPDNAPPSPPLPQADVGTLKEMLKGGKKLLANTLDENLRWCVMILIPHSSKPSSPLLSPATLSNAWKSRVRALPNTTASVLASLELLGSDMLIAFSPVVSAAQCASFHCCSGRRRLHKPPVGVRSRRKRFGQGGLHSPAHGCRLPPHLNRHRPPGAYPPPSPTPDSLPAQLPSRHPPTLQPCPPTLLAAKPSSPMRIHPIPPYAPPPPLHPPTNHRCHCLNPLYTLPIPPNPVYPSLPDDWLCPAYWLRYFLMLTSKTGGSVVSESCVCCVAPQEAGADSEQEDKQGRDPMGLIMSLRANTPSNVPQLLQRRAGLEAVARVMVDSLYEVRPHPHHHPPTTSQFCPPPPPPP